MSLVEDREHERHIDRPHRVHRADRYAAALHALQRFQLGPGRLHLGEYPPSARDQQLTGVRDRDLTGAPLHERQSHLLLEPLDLLRESGLGDVLPRGSTGEVPLLGECHQVLELAQIHKQSL